MEVVRDHIWSCSFRKEIAQLNGLQGGFRENKEISKIHKVKSVENVVRESRK